MKLQKFLLFISITLGLAFSLSAQTVVTGDVAGTVSDSSGAVVPKANINIVSSDTGTTQTTTSNAAGLYHFSLLKPGNYSLSAQSSGLDSGVRNVSVLVGQVTTVGLIMGVKGTAESVDVTEQAPLLQTENANIASSYNEKQLELLPNPGGDITYVAQTAPGVTISTAGGGGFGNFTAFGLPATANLFTVNGNDENDPYLNVNNSGATNLLLGANELQEAAIVSNGYTGQYGRQAGAQVDYSTKSGTNAFHGNAQWSWNGSSLNANDWFNNHSNTPRPFENNNQWAASLGGPIIKNKLFFFADTEGLRYVLPTSQLTFVPTQQFQSAVLANLQANLPNSVPFYTNIFNLFNNAPGANRAVPVTAASDPALGCGDFAGTGSFGVTTPCAQTFQSTAGNQSTEWLLTTRIDYNLGNSDKLFGRFRADHGTQPTFTDPINSVFNAVSVQPQYEGQLNETHVFGPNAVNQLVLSGSWYSALFALQNPVAAKAAFPAELDFGDAPFTSLNGLGLLFPQGRNVTQYQVVDDFSLSRGNHTFKFGVNYRRNDITDFVFGVLTTPDVISFSNTDFFNGNIDFFRQRFPLKDRQPVAIYSLGLYLQDEWRATSNLKFTIALRADRNSNAVCQTNCFSRLNSDFNQLGHDPNVPYNQVISPSLHSVFPDIEKVSFQPRFGFAWTPLGQTSTVIRGGVGLFTDLYPGTLLDRFARNSPNVNQFTICTASPCTLSPTESGNGFALATASNAAFLNAFGSGGTLASIRATVPAFVAPAFNTVPSKLLNPKYLEWNFEVEHQFGSKTSISANYVGNHGYDEFLLNPGLNAFCAASTCPNGFAGLTAAAPDARFGPITDLTNSGFSNYNGVTVGINRRFGYGFQGSANYTFSHSLDTISNGGIDQFSINDSLLTQINPFNTALNYGNSDYDVRHNFTANYIWELPYKFSNKFLENVAGGWTISGTFFAKTGYPFTVTNPTLAARRLGNFNAGNVLAQFLGGPTNPGCNTPDAPCLLASQFATTSNQLAAGVFGNTARGFFRGPGYFNTDLSVVKNFKLFERIGFAVGANAYNVLNHANFANPGHLTNDAATLGQITSTVVPPTSPYGSFVGSAVSGRILQLTGRLTF